MVVLGGVTLNPSILWTDRDSYSTVVQTTQHTLGGALVVFSRSVAAGRPITLEATSDSGWLTRIMLDGLHNLASLPGGVVVLTYHDFQANVIFRHEEPPALEFAPLQQRAIPLPTDYYTGTIKLLTV